MINFSKTENQLFLLYFGAFYFGWCAFIARAEIFFWGLHNAFQGLSFICLLGCVGIVFLNYSKRIPKLPFTNFKFIGLVVFVVWLTMMGAPLFALAPHRFSGAIVQELTSILYIFAGLAFCFFSPRQRNVLLGCFIPLIVLALLLSRSVNVDSVAATASRNDAFDQTGSWQRYALQVGIASCAAPLFILAIATSRSFLIKCGLGIGILLWLYGSLVYSKRQGLLEFAFVMAFLGYFFSFGQTFKGKRIWVLGGFSLLIVIVVGVLMQQGSLMVLLSRVYERFFEVKYEGLEGYDRFAEVIYMFDAMPGWRLLTGKGFLSFDFGMAGFYNMHTGWANLVFKGGVSFALFYLAALCGNILFLLKSKHFPHRSTALFFSAFMIMQLLYTALWGQTPSLFWVGLAFFGPEILLAIERNEAPRGGRMRHGDGLPQRGGRR